MHLITEFQYFGAVNYYKTLFAATNVEFDVYNSYRKMSFRNRCFISGGNGIIELSVPLVHGRNQRVPMKEVLIDNTQKWQTRHWRSIVSAYNKSPWFEYYKHTLEVLYNTPFQLLLEWNEACWKWSLTNLKWNPQWSVLVEKPTSEKAHSVTEITDRWLPKNYNLEPAPVYPQVFEERHGYLPNLSILDLLFCTGPAAKDFLRGS